MCIQPGSAISPTDGAYYTILTLAQSSGCRHGASGNGGLTKLCPKPQPLDKTPAGRKVNFKPRRPPLPWRCGYYTIFGPCRAIANLEDWSVRGIFTPPPNWKSSMLLTPRTHWSEVWLSPRFQLSSVRQSPLPHDGIEQGADLVGLFPRISRVPEVPVVGRVPVAPSRRLGQSEFANEHARPEVEDARLGHDAL